MTDSQNKDSGGLPVAAECGTSLGNTTFQYTNLEILEEGVVLVRRSDAREKIAEERSRKFDEGFFEGREDQREDVKSLVQDKIERQSEYAEREKIVLEELLEELEQ